MTFSEFVEKYHWTFPLIFENAIPEPEDGLFASLFHERYDDRAIVEALHPARLYGAFTNALKRIASDFAYIYEAENSVITLTGSNVEVKEGNTKRRVTQTVNNTPPGVNYYPIGNTVTDTEIVSPAGLSVLRDETIADGSTDTVTESRDDKREFTIDRYIAAFEPLFRADLGGVRL